MSRPRSRAENQIWDSSQRAWSGRLWRVKTIGVWGASLDWCARSPLGLRLLPVSLAGICIYLYLIAFLGLGVGG